MSRPIRPRRSCHVLPGTNERFLAKAASLPADEIILDLKDGAAANHKEIARRRVIVALRTLDFGSKTVAIRINARTVHTTTGISSR